MMSKRLNMLMIDVCPGELSHLMKSCLLLVDGVVLVKYGESLIVNSGLNLEVIKTELYALNSIH
jgi:hypothetical protein